MTAFNEAHSYKNREYVVAKMNDIQKTIDANNPEFSPQLRYVIVAQEDGRFTALVLLPSDLFMKLGHWLIGRNVAVQVC